MTTVDDIASTLSREISRVVERKLAEAIECHLGRVPSNDEVARHGCCLVGPEWITYKWDDQLLFSYRIRLDGFKHVINVTQCLTDVVSTLHTGDRT